MAGQHGGSRPGAGAPSNAERHAEKIGNFTSLCVGALPQCFDNLCTLADGGFERVESKYLPAGTITRKGLAKDDSGNVVRDSKGKPTLVEVPLYPTLDGETLILVERKITTLGPDPKANEYLVNRAMGMPRPSPEEAADLLEIKKALDGAMKAIAARKARPPAPDRTPTPPPTPPEEPSAIGDADDEPE